MNEILPEQVKFAGDEQRFIEEAALYLESPRFLMRVASLVGRPADALIRALPGPAHRLVARATSEALRRGMDWAVSTVPASQAPSAVAWSSSDWLERHRHTVLAAATGASGGFFGLAGLPFELPATTLVMLRSIASIAAEEGADLDDPVTRLNCLAVLSYGSEPLEDMESAYFTARLGLAMAVRQAGNFAAQHTMREISEALARGTAPVLLRIIHVVASRFQVVVTQKAAAQSVPLVGAGMGALINAAFTDHFNRVARYHFGIMRLERRYGRAEVETVYRRAVSERLTEQSKPKLEFEGSF